MKRIKTIIMGAAGRDFHNFNVYYRDNEAYEVVAFTATQIPGIEGKKYPKELSGKLYPGGIPIRPEKELAALIRKHKAEQVILAYSDLPHSYVMDKATLVLSAGADFRLLGPDATMVKSSKPVISICAVRTGCGKSQTSRFVCDYLKSKGLKVVAIRHPMPYGDLAAQAVQRFETYADLDRHKCTIEEREEYEPHIDKGIIVYAGVDYEAILRQAEKEADVIVWDGGNNDFSFYKPDLDIVIADPHRPGDELSYYPGAVNARTADVVIINKVDSAKKEDVETVRKNVLSVNPNAKIIEADSPVTLEKPGEIRGKRVLVVEDGPTLTHGGMKYGAGFVVTKANGGEIIDPRPYAVGELKGTFAKFKHLTQILPAMGYGDQQVKDLEATINKAECDVVVAGTPIDLRRILKANKPIDRAHYKLALKNDGELTSLLDKFSKK